ncbi:MAG: DUF4215 domain-containing protein, partial [Deltaproteobacteria bacterium]|nr:DUF4215 domain-containing protein [Deltaproteobacteria bacterium]
RPYLDRNVEDPTNPANWILREPGETFLAKEACDDNNTNNGDGCSADCLSEEKPGDGYLNDYPHPVTTLRPLLDKRVTPFAPHDANATFVGIEACDDGNALDNDGCSADSLSREGCGDGYLNNYLNGENGPEVCDLGFTNDVEGCGLNCRSLLKCGNNIRDPGEECDEGEAETDTCTGKRAVSAESCRVKQCGNGRKDLGEECDNGEDNADNKACLSNCRINVCGDEFVNETLNGSGLPIEECDEGRNNTGNCNFNCTLPRCGDNITNFLAGEFCDNGRGAVFGETRETQTCNANCTIASCGDRFVNTFRNEVCDDGNNNPGDGCSADCKSAERCGDGYLNNYAPNFEVCDNGSQCADGTTCVTDTDCTDNSVCMPRDSDGCSEDCKSKEVCGDSYLNDYLPYLESCDDGNQSTFDGCDGVNCRVEAGWTCPTLGASCTEVCGDLLVRGLERCDNGKTCGDGSLCAQDTDCVAGPCVARGGDGCTERCEIEPGWTCQLDVDGALPEGGDGGPCDPICGDFLIRGGEGCDDGTGNNAGASSVTAGCIECAPQPGWVCPTDDGYGGVCVTVCGDGVVVGTEECDDGKHCQNLTSCSANSECTGIGDGLCKTRNLTGCNATCKVEVGWDCPGSGSGGACTATCGDGVIRGAETCDDGARVPGDGCSANCTVEDGWACPTGQGIGGVCAPICGDSKVKGVETCDDGKHCANGTSCTTNAQCTGVGDGQCKTRSTDGCTSACQAEEGWTCPTAGAVGGTCSPNCGDKLVRGVETCDEGQLVGGSTSNNGCVSCQKQVGWSCPVGGGVGGTCTSICGDSRVIATDEGCDDGNTAFNDGCSPVCVVEDGWTCSGSPSSCVPSCGDGKIRGTETCDPPVGDAFSRQGCGNNCQTKVGWTCLALAGGVGGACKPICGDGLKEGDEQCDDHNVSNGDGCTASCTTELGWTCATAGQACAPTCGDGLIRGVETCDDSDQDPGDGCNASCQTEDGWRCTVQPGGLGGSCAPICGDTKVRGAENCDDGNIQNGDGCSSSCVSESGWNCANNAGVGGACTPGCGDGLIRGNETCDEGTQVSSPGCQSCQAQSGWSCPTAGGSGGLCVTVCGDKFIRGAEQCDDGKHCSNLKACTSNAECAGIGDGTCIARSNTGCSSTCSFESGWTCPTAGGNGGACSTVCNDGFIRGAETCDDGNANAGDGCGTTCLKEVGWNCPTVDQGGACSPICGDNLIRTGETCDDGTGNNTGANPVTVGCINCGKQDGWSCPTAGGSGGACTSICPDGKVRGTEQCDDNNSTPGDGCDTGCKLETGWTCATPGQACAPTCGDGLVRGAETCDNGKNCSNGTSCTTNGQCTGIGDGLCSVRNNDGCSTSCLVEDGFTCTVSLGNGGTCAPICGDGKKKGSETCDDSNVQAGDGCGATCQTENGWTCATVGQACTPNCGDGLIRGVETCDESASPSAGGCVSCVKQTGWTCPVAGGNGGTCTPTCGDGKVVTGETCDEGSNTASGGCNACLKQNGWTCPVAGGNGGVCTPTCNDGLIRGSESCDEGGFPSSGGGCTACVKQTGWNCPVGGGSGGTCTAVCGDGLIRGAETCDEGGNPSNGGCTSCVKQNGWTCPITGGTGGKCATICGDGLLRDAEQCDDANVVSGDGCDSGCRTESGWACGAPGSPCAPVCGDVILRSAETCDNGKHCPIVNNTLTPCTSDAQCPGAVVGSCAKRDLTGCSLTTGCKTELGWTCPATPSNGIVVGGACSATCGDGRIVTTESCDEGTKPASGICTACNTTQDGWNCVADQSCVPVCGDGKIRAGLLGGENCDDNDQNNNDGCSSSCQRENGYICPGTVGNNGGDCFTCFSTIAHCTAGPDCSNNAANAICTQCDSQYALAVDGKSCIGCADNEYGNGSSCHACGTLSDCPNANVRCDSPTGTNKRCTDCNDGFGLNGSNQCVACADNQYGDGQTCTTCTAMPGCLSANLRCDDPSGANVTCTTCSAGYKKLNGVCVACQPGEFGDGNTCTACDAVPNCASGHVTCTSAADETCDQCDVGFKVQGGACVACASNEYGNGTTCTACSPISGCTGLTCPTGAANSTCSTCQSPLILDGNQCVACVADGDCTATPAATCNLNVLTSYTNDCTALLVCDYPSSQTTCDNGCSAGTCNVAAMSFAADATAVGASASPVSLDKVVNLDASVGIGPDLEAVIVTIPMTPHQSVKELKLVWTDDDFATSHEVAATFSTASGANDLFTATIPAAASGKTIRFYLEAKTWTNTFVYNPGSNTNYTYVTQ